MHTLPTYRLPVKTDLICLLVCKCVAFLLRPQVQFRVCAWLAALFVLAVWVVDTVCRVQLISYAVQAFEIIGFRVQWYNDAALCVSGG